MGAPFGAPSHGKYPALSLRRPGLAIGPARPCRQDPLLAAGAALHRRSAGGHQPHPHNNNKVVRPSGFEPEAYGLEGRCSIQLSYERIKSKWRAR